MGIDDLLVLATMSLPADGNLPDFASSPPQILRAPSGASIVGGSASGLLLAEGDLILAGSVSFRGIVLVRGDLRMESAAGVEGAVLVAGSATLTGEASIRGCPGLAGETLRHPALIRLHSISGGELLGRF
jgi:hypothetical protein